jgi:hypothetical protein
MNDAGLQAPPADPLTAYATIEPTPIHPEILVAREPLERTVADLLAIPDTALDQPWRWRPDDPDDVELRYGFYAIHERLEAAGTAIDVGRAGAPDAIGPAVPPLAQMAAARWELHGVLRPLDIATWDADPGGGEWTVRRTVGHIISGQRGYGWLNAWFVRDGVVGTPTDYPPDGTLPPDTEDEDEATGSPDEVRARLDEIVDANAAASAGLPASAMRISGRWSGLPVTIDDRLGRYGSHIREHTVQVDKTLAMIGREPTEVERLVRLILGTYGRLEARLIAREAAALDRPLAGGDSAIAILAGAMVSVAATAARARSFSTG